MHETTGAAFARMVFSRELHQFCDFLFEAVSDNEKTMVGYVMDLVRLQHDTHH
jgi:hypothetical protein